ncbi:MAG: hypothetical protein BWY59_02030 [Verrucomicrobia bacterium ADurb.Bin345]|nr:MAG: hypothetical protein BWY59_02030 [Verrucomicrobia bacterium ADurb.Bin345]
MIAVWADPRAIPLGQHTGERSGSGHLPDGLGIGEPASDEPAAVAQPSVVGQPLVVGFRAGQEIANNEALDAGSEVRICQDPAVRTDLGFGLRAGPLHEGGEVRAGRVDGPDIEVPAAVRSKSDSFDEFARMFAHMKLHRYKQGMVCGGYFQHVTVHADGQIGRRIGNRKITRSRQQVSVCGRDGKPVLAL